MTSKRALDGESLEDLPASKRARSTWNPVEAVFENQNLVRLIASHLRAENLLPFAFVKKGWSLSILNHDMVIRSVYPNETLKGKLKPVVDLLKRKAIFIPSPIRMLRLVNATKCERCVANACSSVCEDFGVAYCMQCLDSATRELHLLKQDPRRVILNHPRTATSTVHHHNRVEIFREVVVDLNGSLIGPMLTEADMTEVFSKPVTHEITAESLNRVLQQSNSDDPFGIIQRTVDFMFDSKDELDPGMEHSTDILKAVELVEEEQARLAKKLQEEAQAKAEALREMQRQVAEQRRQIRQEQYEKNTVARKTSITATLQKFQQLVSQEPWSDVFSHFTWQEKGKNTSIRLLSPFVQREVGSLLHNKNAASNKRIKHEVQDIQGSMSIVFEQNLHDFSFLSSSPGDEFLELIDARITPYLEQLQTAFLSEDEGLRKSLCKQYGVNDLAKLLPSSYFDSCYMPNRAHFSEENHSTALTLLLQKKFYFFLGRQYEATSWRRNPSPISQVVSLFPYLVKTASIDKIICLCRSKIMQVDLLLHFDEHAWQSKKRCDALWTQFKNLPVQDRYNQTKSLFLKRVKSIVQCLTSKAVLQWKSRHLDKWDKCMKLIWRQDHRELMDAIENKKVGEALKIFRKL